MKKIGLLLLTLCLAAGAPALADGTININNPSASTGSGWTFSGNVVTITAEGNYTITGSSTTNRIVIDKNVTATVTLQNASIHSADASPFALSSDNTGGSQVTLNLFGNNELVSTHVYSAGLTVENNAKITIEGSGSLVVQGGVLPSYGGAAGIGGSAYKGGGNIIITGGTITATGGSMGAAIGGGYTGNGGSITITGGIIIATGGDGSAGIGGGYEADGGNITVTGGAITAIGNRGAGIGGGYAGNGGNITVTGGAVNATSEREGAGIGGGSSGNGGSIKVTGGSITVTGGQSAAGIGGGANGDGGNITIADGIITATGGSFAAGIGGGQGGSGGDITITSGTITANGGQRGAGVGGGDSGNGGSIKVTGGSITVTGGDYAAGIGGGYTGDGGNITIAGGIITATGEDYAAGIGGGQGGSGGDITITSGTITANGGQRGAGVGGGDSGNGGSIKVTGGSITVTGGDYAAGIGGGYTGDGGNITIAGGIITATGGSWAAGIGGGESASGGNITVTGGAITANGGQRGAGIGGGNYGSGGKITIEGGSVTAMGSPHSAGIGGGTNGSGGNIVIRGGVIIAVTPGGSGDPAGIGGGGFADAGTINITGGTVYASGGTGPGIGGGAGATGGVINITGGTVIADEIGIGHESRTETYISGTNTIALSPSINATSFGGAQVLTGTNIGISCTVSSESMNYKVTLHADLIIPSGAILIVPAGIVFDVNHKILVNNGIIREYGLIINTDYLTGNPTAGVVRIGDIPPQVYTGDSIKPLVAVTDGTLTLTPGVHYSVAYTNNVNAGTATVTVTDLGNSYSVTRNFTINPETLASGAIRIEDIPAQEWTGSAIQPAITVKHGDRFLAEGRDYTVAYTDNKDAGIATVRISGVGNYTGSRALNFVIQRAPVTGWTPEPIPDQTYTGDPLMPPVIVTAGEGNLLIAGTDYTVEYSNNVNVGEATAKVTGMGIYTGGATVRFTINPAPVTGAWLGNIPDRTYTGDSITPAITVWDGNRRLLPGTDYALEYSNNINAGVATVTITGWGNYGGTAERDFAIVPKRIAADWLDDIPGQAHTGKALTPAVVVTDSSKVLTAGTDYTVEYSNNVNAGTATVTVTGAGNYAGKVSATFAIVPQEKADSSWWVEALPARTYTGNPIEPLVVVKDKNGTLARGNDYSIKYADNVNVGTATVTVTGRGNYTGAASLTFAIYPQSILDEWLQPIPVQAWTGDSVKPAVTVKDGTRTLVSGRDYTVEYNDNVSQGTAGATVTGVGNFTGTAYVAFEIRVEVKPLTDSLVQDIPAVTYTGYPAVPEVTVTGLSEGRDYTVWYAAPATNVGTYEVRITGRGNYTGVAVKPFVIQSKPITSAMLAGANEHPYTGEAVEPVTVIDHDRNAVLQKDTDYGIVYSGNTEEGVASFTVTGKGNYGGTVSGTFMIVRSSRTVIRAEWIQAIAGGEYTGAAIEPAVTITGLVRGIDYAVEYSGNVNAGTATVTVTGMGNYAGTVNKTFTINPKPIAADWITNIPAQVYMGDSIKPVISVTDSGRALALHTDYTVAWSNNVNAGTATVTVTGVGNYTGTAGAAFAIGAKLLSGAMISVQEEGYYTGLLSEPALTVADGSRTLVAGTDYAAEYSGNVNAGTAMVTVTGRGNYTGTASRTFTIHPKPVAGEWIGNIPDQAYTGDSIKPAVTVTDGSKTLTLGTDYWVTYSNNVNAGTATVTIVGTGNYTGTATGTFRIVGDTAAATCSIRVSLAVSDEARRHIELSFPSSAEYGTVVSIAVHIAEGVEMEGLTVYANGKEIPTAGFDAASRNYKVLLKVEGDMEVTVSGLHLTGTEGAATGGLQLRTAPADGGVFINGLTPGETFSIYTLQGQLVYESKAFSPEETIYLQDKGVYILRHKERNCKFSW